MRAKAFFQDGKEVFFMRRVFPAEIFGVCISGLQFSDTALE